MDDDLGPLASTTVGDGVDDDGGEIDKKGEYQHSQAPFNQFRLTMWDKDALSCDDFMGEITVPLAPLMSCRTLQGWFDLTDPEGAYQNDHDKPLSGRVYLKFKWDSQALLEGSIRSKVMYDNKTVVSSYKDEIVVKDEAHTRNLDDEVHARNLSTNLSTNLSPNSHTKNETNGKSVWCQSTNVAGDEG